MAAVQTCPKCGALIVAQLTRCRQCKTYLHGTPLEGWLLGFLPAQYAEAPGTAVIIVGILVYYFIMVAMAGVAQGPANLLGFSGFTLQQLGALHGPALLQGEHWRYVSYMFGHHDVVHLAFNVSALTSAGPIVEKLFDRKKMFLLYFASGVVAGLGSLVYYVFLRSGHQFLFTSAGASGAVSGMIGAALIGARRQGYDGREVANRMTRWAFLMVLWGFAMPGINNAAHLTGFLAGAAGARLFDLGQAKSLSGQRALSFAVFAGLGIIVVCAGFMFAHRRGYPASLAQDDESRSLIFGITYYHGVDPELSDQKRIWDDCVNSEFAADPPADLLHACELNVRVNDEDRRSYIQLADLLDERGDAARADTLRKIAGRFER